MLDCTAGEVSVECDGKSGKSRHTKVGKNDGSLLLYCPRLGKLSGKGNCVRPDRQAGGLALWVAGAPRV
jgi:hypothetical protein